LVISALILLIGVFASYTRQAWIAVAIALFLAQFFIRDMWKKFLPLFILQLIIIGGILVNSPLLESRVLSPENVNTRVELSRLAWKLFLEKPIFGWGSEAMNAIGLERLGLSSHNTFLSLLVDGGLFLFSAFLIVLMYLSFRIIQVYRKTERNSLGRSVLIAMGGFILIFVMSGMARELRYFGYFNAMFWICAGVIDHLVEGYASREEGFEYNLYRRVSREMVNGD
jgi:O-antigen ligase